MPQNHIINLLLESRNLIAQEFHCLSLNNLIFKQQSIIKDPIVNIDNKLNKFFLYFSSFNPEFLLGNKLIDIFPNWFSFYLSNMSGIVHARGKSSQEELGDM